MFSSPWLWGGLSSTLAPTLRRGYAAGLARASMISPAPATSCSATELRPLARHFARIGTLVVFDAIANDPDFEIITDPIPESDTERVKK
jgi:hypothetical protein